MSCSGSMASGGWYCPKQLRDSPIEYPFKPWDER